MTDRLERLARSGRAAAERLVGARPGGAGGGPGQLGGAAGGGAAALAADPAGRRELEAFAQLLAVRDMLSAARRGQHDTVRGAGQREWGGGG